MSTRELLARRRWSAARLGNVEQVLLGSLVEQMRQCGKSACGCMEGSLHGPYMYLSTRRPDRGMKYVPVRLAGTVRAWVQQGQHAEAVLTEISAVNVELLARRVLDESSAQ